jgi:hypothetical protein
LINKDKPKDAMRIAHTVTPVLAIPSAQVGEIVDAEIVSDEY